MASVILNKNLIKRFDFDLKTMSLAYLIKTLLCILDKEKKVDIIIMKYEEV